VLKALIKLSKQTAAPTVVHLEKPPKFDGKDLSKFRPWWAKVEAYIRSYASGFSTDQHKIDWVGSLLIDKAAGFHESRVRYCRDIRQPDNWPAYVQAIKARYQDPNAKHRSLNKMKELRYKNDTQQYMTELLDLNEEVL
ncbi:hypothetical protein QBC38DRAFT_378583, partial [Podospora fimiseda]